MADHYDIDIAGLRRSLPVSTIAGTRTRIAFLDILGDMELLDAALQEMAKAIGRDTFDVILGGDTVGLVVAHHMSVVTGRPYVCARKKQTPQMKEPLVASAQSVAATSPSMFYLDRTHAARLSGKTVLVVDEVCSTGSTLRALESLAREAGASDVVRAVLATEGSERDDVFALAHLPVWSD